MKRGLLWTGLLATAPCVVLLVALPVGFVMELGRQVRLRIVNRTDRSLRVTPVGTGRKAPDVLRVASQTLHPFLPLPAFRASDLPLEPGRTRTLFYSARATALRSVAVRESDGRLRWLALPAPDGRKDVESGRLVVIDASTPLEAGPAAEVVDAHRAWVPWAVLLAGPLGTFVFFRLRFSLRNRPSLSGNSR